MTSIRLLPIGPFILLLLIPQFSHGDSTSAMAATAENALVDARLRMIEERLEAAVPSARYWQYGWTGFYAASATVQGVLAFGADNGDDRANAVVGAVKATGGLAQMLLKPLPAVRGAEPVPSPSMEKPGDRLESAEALLRENARRAEERTSWKRHLIGIAANLMGGAAIVAFGDTSDAVVSTLTGIAISEAAIWSQPKRAIDDLEDYENRFQRRHAVGRPSWQVSPILAGAVIIVRF